MSYLKGLPALNRKSIAAMEREEKTGRSMPVAQSLVCDRQLKSITRAIRIARSKHELVNGPILPEPPSMPICEGRVQ